VGNKNKINILYKLWESDPGATTMDALLLEVRKRAAQRFAPTMGNEAEDVAQNTVLFVWRSLVDPKIRKFDKDRADFAAYCATVALTQKKKYHRYNRLVCVEDAELFRLIDGPVEIFE
jgi:DNA-directed RNA polymerase specialized sigma24 family protein